jgi:hypothetical protein
LRFPRRASGILVALAAVLAVGQATAASPGPAPQGATTLQDDWPTLDVVFPQEGSRLELYTDQLVVLHQDRVVEQRADRTLAVRVAVMNGTSFGQQDHLHFGFDLEGNFTPGSYGGQASLCYSTECPLSVAGLAAGAHVLELRVHRVDHSPYLEPESGREIHLTLAIFDRAFAAPAAEADLMLYFLVGTLAVAGAIAGAAVVLSRRRRPATGCIVEDVFLIYHDGRLIDEAHRAGQVGGVDPVVLASMLTAVLDFIKDSMKTADGVRGFDYGTRRIMIAARERLILAVALYGRESQVLREQVDSLLRKVQSDWPGPTKSWDGSTIAFSGVRPLLEALLGPRKHAK